jgi:hypothetical protein
MRGLQRNLGITALLAPASLILAACASAKPAEDTFAVTIMAGRLGAMTAQSASLLGETPSIPMEESDADERARVANELRATLYDFTQLKMRACPEGRLEPALCNQDFAPDWALRADKTPPEWPELERRIDAASGAIMPVWGALCEKARETAGPDDEICPME